MDGCSCVCMRVLTLRQASSVHYSPPLPPSQPAATIFFMAGIIVRPNGMAMTNAQQTLTLGTVCCRPRRQWHHNKHEDREWKISHTSGASGLNWKNCKDTAYTNWFAIIDVKVYVASPGLPSHRPGRAPPAHRATLDSAARLLVARVLLYVAAGCSTCWRRRCCPCHQKCRFLICRWLCNCRRCHLALRHASGTMTTAGRFDGPGATMTTVRRTDGGLLQHVR